MPWLTWTTGSPGVQFRQVLDQRADVADRFLLAPAPRCRRGCEEFRLGDELDRLCAGVIAPDETFGERATAIATRS
jgi:hypothetical protein